MTAMDYYLLGDEHYRQGTRSEIEAAAADFEEALRQDPAHFWARYFVSVCYLRLQRSSEARAGLTACLGQYAEFDVWLYLLRGFAESQLNNLEAAESDYKRAFGLVRDRIEDERERTDAKYVLYANRGVLWFQEGRYEQAVQDLLDAIKLKPGEYEARVTLAQVYRKQKRWEDAANELTRAIDLAPDPALLYGLRSRVCLERDDLDGALRDQEKAIALERAAGDSAALARGYVAKGRILARKQTYAQALAAYQEALRVRPNYAEASLACAEAQERLGNHRETVQALDDYLNQGGRPRPEVYRVRGLARARLGQHAEAIQDYTLALGMNEEHAARQIDLIAQGLAAWAVVPAGAPNGSLAPVVAGLGIARSDVQAVRGDDALYGARARAYLATGALKSALADFDEAIRLNPRNSSYYNGRSFARLQAGSYRAAVRDAETALERGPRTPDLIYDAARVYAQAALRAERDPDLRGWPAQLDELSSGYKARAVELLDHAVSRQPSRADAERFWQDRVAKDSALDPIRSNPDFVKLEDMYFRAPVKDRSP
jgi:tetratricopeptide (TPR) repeat protein